MQKAIVIGSGIAGIASALRLKKKGYAVKVFEANSYPGGKLHAFELGQYRFDAGPSLFTMPWLVDELFELFGLNPRDFFEYKTKEVVCNYFWEDGTQFTVHADTDRFVKEAADQFDTPPNVLYHYLENSRKKFALTENLFLKKSLHKWKTYLSADTIKAILSLSKLSINTTLHEFNQKHFSDPHLIQLFNRYATYNGSSPYKTPGIMSMIPHLEMNQGTFFPKGGMHAITKSLFQLAQDQGIEFVFETPIKEITHEVGSVSGVKTNNNFYSADVIVSNMDVFGTYERLLQNTPKPKRVLQQERSSSALIFYWGIKKVFPNLDLHNIFFSENYRTEFEYIFNKKLLYEDPTIYISISSKEQTEDAPAGRENWFVMVNAPGNFNQDWESLKQQAKVNILHKLKRILKTDIAPLIEVESVLDPITIENNTNSHRGALYGTASNSKFAAFLRHPNFSNNLKNLYFCGGSVHPGGGIPLCLLSAKIVNDLIPEI